MAFGYNWLLEHANGRDFAFRTLYKSSGE